MSQAGPEKHYLIGLTGNIATGKSSVMRILRHLGAYTIDADEVAHQVMASEQPVKQAIAEVFGPGVLLPNGEIDRRALGEIVFNDPAALRRLEEIVHPVVMQTIDDLIERASEPVVVIEAIKLIETGMHRCYDALWVVVSPQEQQTDRLLNQRGLTETEAHLRIQAQPPQADKVAEADVVIDNSGSLESLEAQVMQEWTKIKNAGNSVYAKLRGGSGPMNQRIVVRRARQRDVEAIAGIMNSSGWLTKTVTKDDAARMLREKGYLLAISRTGAALVGWQTENLVNCADDFFVYPNRAAESLAHPLLVQLESSATELECEVSVVLIPARGRSILEPILENDGYESKDLSDMDPIWAEVLGPFLKTGQTCVWLKKLREDRVTMPI